MVSLVLGMELLAVHQLCLPSSQHCNRDIMHDAQFTHTVKQKLNNSYRMRWFWYNL